MSGSRRPLPDGDPTIDALASGPRELLGKIWAQRAESELAAGAAFAAVARELEAFGADPIVLALADRAVADEPRHAELCRLLAARYLGREVPPPVVREVTLPEHAGAAAGLLPHLHVTGMCCINESLACAFIESCLGDALGPLVRALHREHLTDEIEHARVGWAHLASAQVDGAVRHELSRWLPRLLAANLENWRSRISWLPAEGVPGHALPPAEALFAGALAGVRDVVLPGFRHVGLDITHAQRWFEDYVRGGSP